LTALDYGSGSLVDTDELAQLGFDIDSIDLNSEALRTYKEMYDWNEVPIIPNIQSITLFELEKNKHYDLITAFDILEHLYDLEDYLAELYHRLAPDGFFIVTVPNKRSLFEKHFCKIYQLNIKNNLPLDTSGVPHVQFKTPKEWRDLFLQAGFKVVAHDMSIGFLVNDCWAGFYGLAARKYLETPFIEIASIFKWDYVPYSFERKLCYPAWIMERVHVIDLILKPLLKYRWGWNLFVLSKNQCDVQKELI
jgi:SAM-dependent methyltransferase